MQTKILLMFISVLVVTSSLAQKKNLSFETTVQAGLLEGEEGSAFQLGVMGGIKSKTWITSIGAGLDYYRLRSIPLYLNVQKNIFNRDKTPFIYLGGGYHFPWLKKLEMDWNMFQKPVFNRGLYYHVGIGYQLPVLKKNSLFFAAGFSEKQFSRETKQTHPCLIGPCPEYTEKISYYLRRLSVTTGLRF